MPAPPTRSLQPCSAPLALWSPAPVPPARFKRAPSSRVRIYDHGARVRTRDVGRAIRGWRNGRWHGHGDYRRRIRRAGIIVRFAGINELRMCAGHTDQRQCSDYSRQHLHFRLPPNSPPRFHRKAGQSARGSASRFVGPLSSILNAPCSRQQPCNSVVPCPGACHAVKCILEVNYPPPCGLRERADTW